MGPRSSACPQQFDRVAVRILDEGDDGAAGIHGSGFANDLATPGANPFCGGLNVVDFDGDVPVTITQVVALSAPVVGKLQDRLVAFVAVADERQRELAIRIVLLAQQAHAEHVSVEVDRALQISDPKHGVKNSHVCFSEQGTCKEAVRRNGRSPRGRPHG